MYEFKNQLNDIKHQFKLTFMFHKKSILFKILKILSLIVFIVPTCMITLLNLFFSFLYIGIQYIYILNIIFMFFIYYFLDIINSLLFNLCNIFELNEYLNY